MLLGLLMSEPAAAAVDPPRQLMLHDALAGCALELGLKLGDDRVICVDAKVASGAPNLQGGRPAAGLPILTAG